MKHNDDLLHRHISEVRKGEYDRPAYCFECGSIISPINTSMEIKLPIGSCHICVSCWNRIGESLNELSKTNALVLEIYGTEKELL